MYPLLPIRAVGESPQPSQQGWWSKLETTKKMAIVLAAVAATLVVVAVAKPESKPASKRATPNKKKRRRKAKANAPYAIYRTEKVRERHTHEPFERIEDAVRHAERDAREKGHEFVVYDEGRKDSGPRGAFVAMFRPNRSVRNSCKASRHVPSCRCSAPAKYARLGATERSDYAFPECWMYPIHTPEFVRAAASRFGKFSGNIPAKYRSKVERRILKAKKRFGIGEFR